MQKNKKPNRQPKVSYETQLLIFNDYLKPELSAEEVGSRYGVSARYVYKLCTRWKKSPPSHMVKLIKMAESKDPGIELMTRRLKKMEQELEVMKLQVEALNKLIDVAEENLEIDIRKKPGSRQQSTSK